MPNWARCNMTITGDAGELDRFVEAAKGIDRDGEECALLLQRLVPMPTELEATGGPKDKPNCLDWRIANWGTKWDTEEPDLFRESDGSLRYRFDAAWCGPIKAIPTISAAFPSLTFRLRHSDQENDWDQTLICCAGEKIESICTDFRNPETRQYWGCEPLCEECGCEEPDCECCKVCRLNPWDCECETPTPNTEVSA
jgi:Ferredoxin-like domain in Api92-like protein